MCENTLSMKDSLYTINVLWLMVMIFYQKCQIK